MWVSMSAPGNNTAQHADLFDCLKVRVVIWRGSSKIYKRAGCCLPILNCITDLTAREVSEHIAQISSFSSVRSPGTLMPRKETQQLPKSWVCSAVISVVN